ncbi:MAG TPA: hypothetical protein VIQ99_05480 [Gammaproteobacteria bacterium]
MDTLLRRFGTTTRAVWLAALAALTLAGCGGSGGSTGSPSNPSTPSASTGTLLISVTDADGDFVSYSVDVLSVTLQRRGGGTVEVLPATTRIDFAQLTDLSDLLSVATLAPGDIVGGKIRLDYGNAEIFIEQNGQVVRANAVGANGAPLGVVELDIQLAEREHLVVTRGRAALLALDFDLAASNEVDLTRSPPVVTARPYVVAEAEPVTDKELRLRGALVSTDTQAGTYTVDVRPWFRPDGNHGGVTIHTTSSTTFEIDGVTATGNAGLAALARKPAGTMTVAFGTLALQDHRFTAEIVHAGDSVSGEGIDAIHGNIVARNGTQLTVKGAYAVRRDRVAHLRRTVIVSVGPNTKVLKTGAPGAVLDATALSVGQSIVAFGSITEPASDTAPATFDATNGRVRMLPTHLHGNVNVVLPGQLNLNLRAIDRLGIDLFDFTGTGVTQAQDADPTDYEIATSTLPLAGVTVGQPAKVLGHVRPFGSAPADFEGRTVIDHRALPAMLGIGWGETGTQAPFLSMGPAGLVLDIDNSSIGARHTLILGRQVIDLTTLATPPTIAPTTGRALYGISVGRDVRLFSSFSEFSDAVAAELALGKAVGLVALGSWDEGSSTLRAHHIAMHFVPN